MTGDPLSDPVSNKERIMRKTMVLFIPVMVFLFLAGHTPVYAQSAQKQQPAKKKSGKSRIVVEYVAFPEQLKQYDVYPWDTLKIEGFQNAYTKMTGQGALEEWVKSLTGTAASKNRMVRAFREQFVLVVSCKPHMCDESQVIVLYDPVKKQTFSVLARDGKFYWFGDPPEKIRDLLNILLVDEFKDIYKAGK